MGFRRNCRNNWRRIQYDGENGDKHGSENGTKRPSTRPSHWKSLCIRNPAYDYEPASDLLLGGRHDSGRSFKRKRCNWCNWYDKCNDCAHSERLLRFCCRLKRRRGKVHRRREQGEDPVRRAHCTSYRPCVRTVLHVAWTCNKQTCPCSTWRRGTHPRSCNPLYQDILRRCAVSGSHKLPDFDLQGKGRHENPFVRPFLHRNTQCGAEPPVRSFIWNVR